MSAAASTIASFGMFQGPGKGSSWHRQPGEGRGLHPDSGALRQRPAFSAGVTGAESGTREQMHAANAIDREWTEVVRRCLQGDSFAWTELVRAHHGRVYSVCYRFTNSAPDAEDLTQDVFLKVYGSLRSFDAARGSLAVWLTTMTRNHLVDHYRRTRMQRASDSLDAGWDDTTGEAGFVGVGNRLEDSRPGPQAQVLQQELARQVQAALARVSPELREAVILRDLQDMDYKDIAVVLQVPEGTVKSRISRGRAELARILGRGRKQVS